MIRHTPKLFAACLVLFTFVPSVQPQTPVKIPASQSLQVVVDEAARSTLAKFADKEVGGKTACDHSDQPARRHASDYGKFSG